MVFETYTTNDYSFHFNEEYNPRRLPQTHNDIYYHRMQEQSSHQPQEEPSLQHITMSNINLNSKGESYHEFVYSPLLPKTLSNTDKETNGNSVSVMDYLKRLFCCG